jgi:hypothetical protein
MADDRGGEAIKPLGEGEAVNPKPGPDTPWVELRIHGVSGTPPADMLGSAHVVQVAGDPRRRVFQRADADGIPLGRDDDGRVLEGYHWGNLTSGSWRQGLWFLLIPFGFVNAAQFMLLKPPPAGPGEGRLRRRVAVTSHVVSGAMLRVVGVVMTCALALAAAFIVASMAALRAAHQADLDEFWLRVLPVLGLAATAGVVGILFMVGGRTRPLEYERSPRPHVGVETGLATTAFFTDDPSVTDLRRLHLSAGLAMAGLPGGFTLGNDGGWVLDTAVWIVLLGVLGLCGALILIVGDLSKSNTITFGGKGVETFKDRVHRLTRWANRLFLAASAGALVVEAARLPFGLNVNRLQMQKFPDIANYLAVIAAISLGVLFVSVMLLAVTGARLPPELRGSFGPFVFGMAAFFVATLGTFIGLGFAGAFAYAAAQAMGIDTNTFPAVLQRIAYAWGVTALLLVVVVLALLANWTVRARWRLPWERPATRSTFRSRAYIDFEMSNPSQSRVGADPRIAEAWERKIATAMWMARLKRRLPPTLVWIVLAGVIMSVAGGIELIRGKALPGLLDHVNESQQEGTGFMTWLGAVAMLALGGLLVSVGRGSVRAQSKRRAANVIWDVIAFWPHTTHPFAPPPYSQLCVLDFRDRIRFHLGTMKPAPERLPAAERKVPPPSLVPAPRAPHGGARVVITAHSQGSLITIAALLWLDEDERTRVGVVTHGSQLQVAFPRAFPAYVHVDLLRAVLAAYGRRWVNLYRETDHIAGPVFSWNHWRSAREDRALVREQIKQGAATRQPGEVATMLPSYPYASRAVSRLPGVPPDTWAVDRLADAVFSTGLRVCGHDWRLLDPAPHDQTADLGPVVQIRAHSGYPADAHWAYAVNAVGGAHRLDPYPPPFDHPGPGSDALLPE